MAMSALRMRSSPVVTPETGFTDMMREMGAKGLGAAAITDADSRVLGIFTDGDLRRCLARIRDISATPISAVMTKSPRTIEATRLAIDCVDLMETPPKVSQLLVVDSANRLVGALHLHDLFRARVV